MSEIRNHLSMENLLNLGAKEIEIIHGLIPIAEKAAKAAEIIHKTYRFAIGEESIVVWSDDYNQELLTHTGFWQARYLHQKYDVRCTKEDIFRHYKAAWLINNGYVSQRNPQGGLTEEAKLMEVCRYFESFVRKTESLYLKNNGTLPKNDDKDVSLNDEFVTLG